MTPKNIGILIGNEQEWLHAFIDAVGQCSEAVTAESILLGGTPIADACGYDVIVDRLSHTVPYYRTFLKTALLAGTTVLNNPFRMSAFDSFFGASLATRLGIAHPRTIALPTHSYAPWVGHDELGNLVYPIPWNDHVDTLGGFPMLLRPVQGNTGPVYRLESFEDLWHCYNETGTAPAMLQEQIAWDKYVRCLVIGEQTRVLNYNPSAEWSQRYGQDDGLATRERTSVLDTVQRITPVLGYDVCALDLAFNGNTLYLMDVISPAPDFDARTLPEATFAWTVQAMADVAVAAALAAGDERQPMADFRWEKLTSATQRVSVAAPAAEKPKPAPKKKSTATAPAAEQPKPATEEKTPPRRTTRRRSTSTDTDTSS